VIRHEAEWRLEVVRNEGHLDIVPPVAFVKTGGERVSETAGAEQAAEPPTKRLERPIVKDHRVTHLHARQPGRAKTPR
jgi:hypothetical protein